MQIAKWGNSLAVRLPAALIRKLGLKPGDEVEVLPGTSAAGKTKLEVRRKPSRRELIEGLRQYRWQLPDDYRFDREEANQRGGGR